MLGQVATLRDRGHDHRRAPPVDRREPAGAEVEPDRPRPEPADIAIVGMSAILPGAGDVRTFWENTLRKQDAVTEVPADRWDWRLYYDADPKAPDKVVSKWGGFVPDVPFDPLRYGMPPTSLPSIEPVQLLLLEATRAAIDDAGYADRPFARERTAVVLGMGGGAAQLAMGYAFRSYLPMLDAVTPGLGAGRARRLPGVAPRVDRGLVPRLPPQRRRRPGGQPVRPRRGELHGGRGVRVVARRGGAGGPRAGVGIGRRRPPGRGRHGPEPVHLPGVQQDAGVLAARALPPVRRLGRRDRDQRRRGDGRPQAPGDAERDGDRIYSVIKGLGASSDGRARGLTAPAPTARSAPSSGRMPRPGSSRATIGYVEAHGTGTAVGDVVEVNAISGVFRSRGVAPGSVAIGSVKSMIGHTKCAAGLAGLINASLALHHRVLPPTIGVAAVNPKADLADGPFRVNTEARPWLHADSDPAPARRGERLRLRRDQLPRRPRRLRREPAPAIAPRAIGPPSCSSGGRGPRPLGPDRRPDPSARRGGSPALRDLARAVNAASRPARPGPTLAIVAESLDDLRRKLRSPGGDRRRSAAARRPPRGLLPRRPRVRRGPGRVPLPRPGVADARDARRPGDRLPRGPRGVRGRRCRPAADGRPAVGPLVFPPPSPPRSARAAASLAATDRAQPALGAASVGLLRLLGSFGIEADLLAGHSFGELVALHAAGSIGVAGLARLAHERGRLMLAALGDEPGAMAAVAAGVEASPRCWLRSAP